jgi:hypothetical protein
MRIADLRYVMEPQREARRRVFRGQKLKLGGGSTISKKESEILVDSRRV